MADEELKLSETDIGQLYQASQYLSKETKKRLKLIEVCEELRDLFSPKIKFV